MTAPYTTLFIAVMDILERHAPDLPIGAAGKITRDLSDKFYDLLESAPIPPAPAAGEEVKDAEADDDRRPLHPFHNMKSLAEVEPEEEEAHPAVILVGDSITEMIGKPDLDPDVDDDDADHEPPPVEDGAQDPETLQTSGGGKRMPKAKPAADKPLPYMGRKILKTLLELRERGTPAIIRGQLRKKVGGDARAYGQSLRILRERRFIRDTDDVIVALADLDGRPLPEHTEAKKDARGITVCPPRYAAGYGFEPSRYAR